MPDVPCGDQDHLDQNLWSRRVVWFSPLFEVMEGQDLTWIKAELLCGGRPPQPQYGGTEPAHCLCYSGLVPPSTLLQGGTTCIFILQIVK